MKIYDECMNEIKEPDIELGRIEERSKPIVYRYIVDVEEQTHEVVIAEYPNGGKDIEYVVDIPEEGHWEASDEDGEIIETDYEMPDDYPHELTFATEHRWLVYVPYTAEELEDIETERRLALEERLRVEEREAFLLAAPVVQAEQDAAICELYEQNLSMQAESDRAITDLYEMLLEVCNG
jgi:hypothetical protein|nr:MAG TPA: hypothetical protein [Caudoviricetes sp.]